MIFNGVHYRAVHHWLREDSSDNQRRWRGVFSLPIALPWGNCKPKERGTAYPARGVVGKDNKVGPLNAAL